MSPILSNYAVYNGYIPTESGTTFYEDKSYMVYTTIPGSDVLILKILPNAIVTLADNNQTAGVNTYNEAKAVEAALKYAEGSPIPETGFIFLVEGSTSELLYCFNTGDIMAWDKMVFLPPHWPKGFYGSILMFYDDPIARKYLPVRMYNSMGKDVAIYLRQETKNFLTPVTDLQTSRPFGEALIAKLVCMQYGLEEVHKNILNWAVHPTYVVPPYEKSQTHSLEVFVERHIESPEAGFTPGPAAPKTPAETTASENVDKRIRLSAIFTTKKIPNTADYTEVVHDLTLGAPGRFVDIMYVKCCSGHLYLYVKEPNKFSTIDYAAAFGMDSKFIHAHAASYDPNPIAGL
jgi:hypothetical protein